MQAKGLRLPRETDSRTALAPLLKAVKARETWIKRGRLPIRYASLKI